MEEIVRFYFSFRSPYAWFAAERWHAVFGDLKPALPVERVPFFPTLETFPNDPTLLPAKFAYVVQDVRRHAREYGLAITAPCSLDTDWARAHAAYLGVCAAEPERAEAFMLEMFRSRFSRGLDVALPEVIADAAERAGADARGANEAGLSPDLQAQVARNFAEGQARDGIFGAPSFVYRSELFWGHDRMHHLRRAVLEGAGSSAS
jgi:2-hydroxychromene-2-carboxylate isomerase